MIGKQLHKARKEAGYSQEELAHRAGIHRTYISLLEGDKKSPTVDVLFRLCDALNISPSEFVRRVERSKK